MGFHWFFVLASFCRTGSITASLRKIKNRRAGKVHCDQSLSQSQETEDAGPELRACIEVMTEQAQAELAQ